MNDWSWETMGQDTGLEREGMNCSLRGMNGTENIEKPQL